MSDNDKLFCVENNFTILCANLNKIWNQIEKFRFNQDEQRAI